MTAYEIFILIVKIIFGLAFFTILAEIHNLIRQIANNIETKTASIKLSDKIRMMNKLEARVNSTTSVLNLIDTIIVNEVGSTLKTYARLGEAYKSINTADDIAKISTKIFNSLKKEIFADNDTVLTDEYIMTYINEQTTLIFLIESQKLSLNNK